MPDLSPPVQAALREYEMLHEASLRIYQHYVRCLVFVGLAAGTIAVVITQGKMTLETLGYFSIGFTLLINAWVAGWAFLNLELWAHRWHLSRIEGFLRSQLGMAQDDRLFNFYRTKIGGMYDTRVWIGKGHMWLDVFFAGVCLLVYIVSLALATCIGIPNLSKCREFSGPLREFLRCYVPGALALCSVSVLIMTLVVWGAIACRLEEIARETPKPKR